MSLHIIHLHHPQLYCRAELTESKNEATHMTKSRSQKSQKQQKLLMKTTAHVLVCEQIEHIELLNNAKALMLAHQTKSIQKRLMLLRKIRRASECVM